MATRILVTGATGTTGQLLVEQLAGMQGLAVRATSRSTGKAVKDGNIEYVPFDYHDAASIQRALHQVQKVCLVTPFVPELFDYESAVIAQLRQSGVQHVVKLSVAGADQHEGITFGKMHGQLEQLIQDTGLPFTFLRPMPFMQNYANFMSETIQEENAFYLPMGEGKVSVVDARDVAAVAVKALAAPGHEGQTYTLTGPEALSNYEIAAILSEVLRREISYVDVSEQQAREAMEEASLPQWSIACLLELYRGVRAGAMDTVSRDIEKVTGSGPITFREFVQDYADVFR
jgi:uncharacterized protein YbjT (DUF2867 family)